MKPTMIALLVCCNCLVFATSTVASSKEKCDTMPQYDTVARASVLYQMAVDYFLTRSFCGDPSGEGGIWCYFAPPSSIPMEEMCRVADSLRQELTKDWQATRRLLMSPASTMPGFVRPTINIAPSGMHICDKATYHYYKRDGTLVPVVGTRGIVTLVVKWLDEE